MWAIQFGENRTVAWDENGNCQVGDSSSPPSGYSVVDDTSSPVTYGSDVDWHPSNPPSPGVPPRPGRAPDASMAPPAPVTINGPNGPMDIPGWLDVPTELLSGLGSGSGSGSGSGDGSGSGSSSGYSLDWQTYGCGGYSLQLNDNLWAVAFLNTDGSWWVSWSSNLAAAGNLAQGLSDNEPIDVCPCISPMVSACLGDSTLAVSTP